MKYSIVTLGCPKNQVDSEHLISRLTLSGHRYTDGEDAEMILLNTCSFIEEAKAESVETIIEAVSTGRRVLVLGCLPARYRDELRRELPEVEAFFGVGEEDRLVSYINGKTTASAEIRPGPGLYTGHGRKQLLNASHFAYLKIAEGCDNNCTYCVIPAIRGPYTSVQPQQLLNEARQLAERGVKELILVAQDTTAYGKDSGNNLEGLLADLSDLDFAWIRLMYAYPDAITPGLLKLMRSRENICAYLDIPLQHSEDSVLKRMGRPRSGRHGRAPLELINSVRDILPDVVIRSTFIVGFPGETEAEFQGLLDFLEEARLDRVGAFMYSREEGTPAARMPDQVPEDLKQQRLDRLMALQAGISYKRNVDLVGTTAEVLVDECEDDISIGRTRGDAPEVDGCVIVNESLRPGIIVPVRITEAQDYDLVGVPVETAESEYKGV